jgi:hypothetical protein
MEGANKIISFILGLVVVVVFLAIVTGRIKLGNIKFPLAGGAKITPTVTVTPTPSGTATNTNGNFHPYASPTPGVMTYGGQSGKPSGPASIPNTGSETILLPIAISALGGGFFLKKKAK